MYISLDWLKQTNSLNNLSLTDFCEKICLAGFEVEEVYEGRIEEKNSIILDVSLTANRSDLNNIIGLRSELATIFGYSKRSNQIALTNLNPSIENYVPFYSWEWYLQSIVFKENNLNNNQSLLICDPSVINLFSLQANNCKLDRSTPRWIKHKLLTANILPECLVSDLLNFVALETGYNFLVFDKLKLVELVNSSSLKFNTRFAKQNEVFKSNANKQVTLTENNILLTVNDYPISVIGLYDNEEIKATNHSNDIIILGGIFAPELMRKSSQSLGLRTDVSARLSKPQDINGLEKSFVRLLILLNTYNIISFDTKAVQTEILNYNNSLFLSYLQGKQSSITLRPEKFYQLIGNESNVDLLNLSTILQSLNFKIEESSNKQYVIQVPANRQFDITEEIDIIEELIRINGFEGLNAKKTFNGRKGKLSNLEQLKRHVRTGLIKLGLSEMTHYTLGYQPEEVSVCLQNPLSSDSRFLRDTLIPNLLSTVEKNKRSTRFEIEAFEIGRIYKSEQTTQQLLECEIVTGVFGNFNYSQQGITSYNNLHWLEAKNNFQQVLNLINIEPVWIPKLCLDNDFYAPNKSADLYIEQIKVGSFGQIHPRHAFDRQLSLQTFIFELNLGAIESFWNQQLRFTYTPFSLQPTFSIDLACLVKNELAFSKIQATIANQKLNLLKDVIVFDYYTGNELPPGFYSIGLRLVFQSFDHTLTMEEITPSLQRVKDQLKLELDIQLRD